MNVLFVCSGNTCRSPMAQAIAAYLAKSGGDEIRFSSAGLYAYDGQDMSEKAKLALKEMGIEYTAHFSRRLTLKMIETADMILCMEPAHVKGVLYMAPNAEKRVFLLSSFCGENGAIRDPFGDSLGEYISCAQQILSCLEKCLPQLRGAR